MEYFKEVRREGDTTVYEHIGTGQQVRLSNCPKLVIPDLDLEDELFYQLSKKVLDKHPLHVL